MPSGIYQHKKGINKGKIPWNKGKQGLQIAWNKGLKNWMSEEGKKRIIESRLGKKHTEEWKQKMSKLRKGKKPYQMTEEIKQKISETCKKKGIKPLFPNKISWNKGKKCPQMSGEKNGLWKGGITPKNQKIRSSLEYKLWEDSVFARDGYRCQKNGEVMKPYKLTAHHILNFSKFIELRTSIENGITLSKEAHQKFHKKYGFYNNTKEQLEEFLNP